MGTVDPLATAARPFIAISTAPVGLLSLRTTASAHRARLIGDGAMAVISSFTVTTSFATSMTALRTFERAQHASCADYRLDGSHFH